MLFLFILILSCTHFYEFKAPDKKMLIYWQELALQYLMQTAGVMGFLRLVECPISSHSDLWTAVKSAQLQ